MILSSTKKSERILLKVNPELSVTAMGALKMHLHKRFCQKSKAYVCNLFNIYSSLPLFSCSLYLSSYKPIVITGIPS